PPRRRARRASPRGVALHGAGGGGARVDGALDRVGIGDRLLPRGRAGDARGGARRRAGEERLGPLGGGRPPLLAPRGPGRDAVSANAPPATAPAEQASPTAQATTPPAIRVRHLWHRFGRFDVLRDVSFEVGHGEIFGFIGPNGAGKTTTIRIMATLLEPLSGRVEVDGFDVSVDPEAVRKIIGYMPDHAGVYERVTVREYLEFFADAYKVAPDANYSVVDAVMELTDLTKLSDKLVATMSKGMKQRLQLARTLLHDPKVLILDEPASDLDPRARIEIR